MQDTLSGLMDAALFLLLAHFVVDLWGCADSQLAVLSLPLLLFRLGSVVTLLRPSFNQLFGPKGQKY